MTPSPLSNITRQIAALSWRDRLVLLGQLLKSFFPHPLQAPASDHQDLAAAFAELQQICIEEDYELEPPDRADRANAFSTE